MTFDSRHHTHRTRSKTLMNTFGEDSKETLSPQTQRSLSAQKMKQKRHSMRDLMYEFKSKKTIKKVA